MFKKIKDPVSAFTHMAGAIIAIPLTILLIQKAINENSTVGVIAFSIFGAALILLYTASTVYHMLPVSEKTSLILKRVDHMMIFVLIAGTYTPICLIPLRGPWGYSLLALVWIIAFAGILLKAFWIDAPRWLSTTIYIVMGWVALIAFVPLVKSLPIGAILLLVLGGVTYTIGGVIYAIKWPKLNFKHFGFHEIFHLFVLGGSAFHVCLMFFYISNSIL